MNNLPTFDEEKILWNKGYELVIGVDEVGRGCFAGPVVASACAFVPVSRITYQVSRIEQLGIHDSKLLTPTRREKLANEIKKYVVWGIGEVGVNTINKVGIAKASEQAMRKAVASIMYQVLRIKNKSTHNTYYKIPNTKPFVLIDAFYIPHTRGISKAYQKPIIKGDQKSISIAAASIIAKVYRDTLMEKLAKKYVQFGWESNKGYGTLFHRKAIISHGITKLHRTAFVETFLLHTTV